MNAKMIVILMMLVLLALFAWSKYFRRKEKKLTVLEAASFEATQAWLNNKNDENHKRALEANAALSQAHGTSPDKAIEMAKLELERMN